MVDTILTDIFDQLSLRIIKEQEPIIGPVAWNEARKVAGFTVLDAKNKNVSISGDGKEVINKLVAQYERLFGRASHEVCKEVTRDLVAKLSDDQIPSSLK